MSTSRPHSITRKTGIGQEKEFISNQQAGTTLCTQMRHVEKERDREKQVTALICYVAQERTQNSLETAAPIPGTNEQDTSNTTTNNTKGKKPICI